MQRRSFLRTAGAGTVVATAGCLTSVVGDDDGHTVLEPPKDPLRPDSPHPAPESALLSHGESFPHFSLPDPIADTTVETNALEGFLVWTAFYDFCTAECAPLISDLARVQYRMDELGYSDDVTFLAVTFDPERDTLEVLQENAAQRGVDLEAGNWHYLRPDDEAEAESIVADDFGVVFERVGEGGGYDFKHAAVSVIANPAGYVERAYRSEVPEREGLAEDLETALERWEE
ncbi:SCO family protein [Natrialbaceae archaeon AArc-T1-2]|uniref:SCO family protein n=1 Tax=Natrialbaceae archaeon AArc-T1-2 TaxID=3053904 RepID=UPI00255AF052|nr:SCO family protein [Natrialbaceae archaeon AArc-T1-2]WIV67252.1 SCO family protein [Natrialbaceae archaeon AArc-T1-2]